MRSCGSMIRKKVAPRAQVVELAVPGHQVLAAWVTMENGN